VKFEGAKGSVKSGTMEALSTTLSTRPALYIGLGLLAAALAIKVVAPVLYNRLVFYLRMAVVFVYSVYAGTSTWLYGIRQERLAKEDGKKADPKLVMGHCSGLIKSIFPVLRIKFEIDIPKSVNINASYVIILNHQHALDAYLLNQLLPLLNFPRIVMKEELRGMGPIGKAFECMNALFVKRGTKSAAMTSLIEGTKKVKEDGDSIVLFPEGTRHLGDELLPFKLGAFNAAVAAQVPILPVVISNYKKLPDYLATGSTVKVKILQPVSTQGLGEDEVQTLADKCRDIMSDVFHKL